MPTTLNKPANLTVFPPHADPAGNCLLAQLLSDQPWRRDIHWPEGFEGGIAHRLDTATSGAVMVADSLDELDALRELFGEHRFNKKYLMLTDRRIDWDAKNCDLPIGHHARKKNRMVVKRSESDAHRGKWYPAHSGFVNLRTQRRDRLTLIEVTITTGVTHQVRIHAAALGVPILGDELYDGSPLPKSLRGHSPMCLHHRGLLGPGRWRSEPVPDPKWA